MEYLQYLGYKEAKIKLSGTVLNLIINGIPSIHKDSNARPDFVTAGFKPYYKWNTFNTRSYG